MNTLCFLTEFTRRIVVLGKTGAGKSSLANTLFGEKVCETNHSPTSGTAKCQAESRIVNGRSVTVIDTPGFFDTGRSEEEMKVEIVRCITECAPGPHVFIIVLKVEKYTEQENEVINRMADYFSDDALRFSSTWFLFSYYFCVCFVLHGLFSPFINIRRKKFLCTYLFSLHFFFTKVKTRNQALAPLDFTVSMNTCRVGEHLTNTLMSCHCSPLELTTFRIVLLGKSRNGKSSLANVLFGETKFKVKNLNDSNTVTSDARTKCIKGRNLTLIDTPGFLDPGRTEKEVKPELTRCVAECAPGPHVFLIVLKVEKHTEHEKAVINNIREYFSGDALKYAVVVFTHGDQLPEGMKIEEFVDQSEELKELVEKCGGRCHVFDCKYWKNNDQEDAYRSNQLQMAELLNTIDKILMENTGGYYTNTILRDMEREIQEEERSIQETSQKMSKEEIRELAKSNVVRKQLKILLKVMHLLLNCFLSSPREE
uniref:AIG1-type G domain-containing protein n=1 Tax=Nothobranchius furzeri TaxID=105023 RepID=A0A8C6P7N3_NOTFU